MSYSTIKSAEYSYFQLLVILLIASFFHFGSTLELFRSSANRQVTQPVAAAEGVIFYYVPSPGILREIKYNDFESVLTSDLKDGASTVFLIDGFGSNSTTPFVTTVSNAFLSQGKNQNIFIVDYASLSGANSVNFNGAGRITAPFVYLRVLRNVQPVGIKVADFINYLHTLGKVTLSDVHIIGMSLGGHIASIAGIYLKEQYGGMIGRITGLDPAITFGLLRDPLTVRNGSANFTDIYHSNRGVLGETRENTGDINVYINGGSNQPGCEILDRRSFPGYCSHSYAWKVFSASFFKTLLACHCSGSQCLCRSDCDNANCFTPTPVGIAASNRLSGTYRLDYIDPL